MSVLDDIIKSNLPNEIINSILFYSNPRMKVELQYQIKNFTFRKYVYPFTFDLDNAIINHSINYNVMRIGSGMIGFPVL